MAWFALDEVESTARQRHPFGAHEINGTHVSARFRSLHVVRLHKTVWNWGYTVSREEQVELGRQLIGELRQSFARGDWDETTRTYEQIASLKTDRAVRLEATCLAARALVAVQQRSAARHLLKMVAEGEYKKPAHYEFLARAYLDLKQYKGAAEACARAEELRVAELK